MKITKTYEFNFGKYNQINYQLENGLKIEYYPYPSFHFVSIGFLVPFGGNMSNYIIEGKRVTLGVAHFLEHRMFDSSSGDVSDEYSRLGAFVNAWTAFDRTAYFFNTSFDYIEPFKILLNQMNSFYSLEERFENERKIILEEAKTSFSDDSRILRNKLFNALFENNILNTPVIGTLSSIKNITLDEVKKAFNYFYDFSKLTLVVVGACDIEELFKILENFDFRKIKKEDVKYDPLISLKEKGYNVKYAYKDIASPIDIIGFKMSLKKMEEEYGKLYGSALLNVTLDFAFSQSSKFVEKLQKEGIILQGITPSYITCDDDLIVTLDYQTTSNKRFKDELENFFLDPSKYFDERKFSLYLKKELANNIRTLENPISFFDEILFSTEKDFNCLEYYSKNTKILYNDIVKLLSSFSMCQHARAHLSCKEKAKLLKA